MEQIVEINALTPGWKIHHEDGLQAKNYNRFRRFANTGVLYMPGSVFPRLSIGLTISLKFMRMP